MNLDAAWKRAEEALPEWWHNGPTVTLRLFGYDVEDGGRSYVAGVERAGAYKGARHIRITGDGDSPAAALVALAEKLEVLA